eukprot:5799836-Amphidinium_carterae.1
MFLVFNGGTNWSRKVQRDKLNRGPASTALLQCPRVLLARMWVHRHGASCAAIGAGSETKTPKARQLGSPKKT